MAKKLIDVTLTLSVDEHISPREALREVRTRIDDVTGHYWDATEKKVRVKKAMVSRSRVVS